jgi:hypothetical protein
MRWLRMFRKREHPGAVLAGSLMCMAGKCTDKVFEGREFPSEREQQEAQFKTFCEFTQCFICITDRWIFSLARAEKREEVMRLIVNSLADTVTNLHFPNAPEHIREGIRREFLHNLDVAQCQYSSCTDLLIEGKPLAREGILNQLAFNVADVLGTKNPVTLITVVGISLNAMKEMDLRGLTQRVASTPV